MSRLKRLLVHCLLGLSIAGCTPQSTRTAPTSLRIAVSAGFPASCPLLVAAETGLFARENVAVQLVSVASGVQALSQLQSSQVDLATMADVPFALNMLEGKAISTVASLARFDGGISLVLKSSSTTFIRDALRGKRIAVTLRSAGHYATGIILARHGLLQSDVKLVGMQPQEIAAALSRGDIDGFTTWEPYLSRTLEALSSNKVLRLETENLYVGHWLLVGQTEYLRKHQPAIEAVLRALEAASPQCEGSAAPGPALMIRKGQISAEEVEKAWKNFQFDVALDQGLILALEDQAAWAQSSGIAPAKATLNVLNHLDSAALRAALPHNITIAE